MTKKGFARLIILLALGIVVLVVGVAIIRHININNRKKAIKPYITNNSELIFLSANDRNAIFEAIDSSADLKDFDKKVFNAYSDVLDSYNAKKIPGEDYLISPEFMSDNPEAIEVTHKSTTVDLLSGPELLPLTNSDLPDLKRYAKLYFEEIFKYPISWMSYTTPPVIVFSKSLSRKGEAIGGTEQGVIIFNTSTIFDEDFTRKTIHHELFHWVIQKTGTLHDPDWPGALSNYAGKYDLLSENNYLEHPKDGFVTGYATTNSNEDRAEIYAYLFMGARQDKLDKWLESDKILKKKVDYIKTLIRSRVSKMDGGYFEKIQT